MSKQSTMTLTHKRRRSLRVHLETLLPAYVNGIRTGTARVRDLAIGGAFLEMGRKLKVGESIHLEIPAGLQSFQCDGIVRNVTPEGVGIEFVRMKPEDRQQLRFLITKLLE
jgi:hypothetical protein